MTARAIIEKIKRDYSEINWVNSTIVCSDDEPDRISIQLDSGSLLAFIRGKRKHVLIHHFLDAVGEWQGILDDYIMISKVHFKIFYYADFELVLGRIKQNFGKPFFTIYLSPFICYFIKVESDSDVYLKHLEVLRFGTLEDFLEEMTIELTDWNDYGYYTRVNLRVWEEQLSVRINPLSMRVFNYLRSSASSWKIQDFFQVRDRDYCERFLRIYLDDYRPYDHQHMLDYLTNRDIESSKDFCSLGDAPYYEFLKKYLPYKERQRWFQKIQDLAYDLKRLNILAEKYESLEDSWGADFNFTPPYGKAHNFFNNSFMRSTSLKEIRDVFHPLTISGWEETLPATKQLEDVLSNIIQSVDNKISSIDYEFTDISGSPTVLQLKKPTKDSVLPTAVYALVGGNGSGKSHRIRQIIESHINGDNKFSQLLHFSLSPFDQDIRADGLVKDDNGDMVYEKVGFVSIRTPFFNEVKEKLAGSGLDNIRNHLIETAQKKGLLDDNENVIIEKTGMKERFIWYIQYLLLDLITSKEKLKIWSTSLDFFTFESWARDVQHAFSDGNITLVDFQRLETLSSGQATILLYLTKLAFSVNQGSLIIFDEPETFMHPPMVKAFIRAVSEIVSEKKALCLIATHSPVIIQEIPHSNVYRLDVDYRLIKPHYKTYGQNLDTLYKTIYGVELQRTGYNELLNERSQRVIKEGGNLLPEDDKQYLGDEAYLKYLVLEEWIGQGGDERLDQ